MAQPEKDISQLSTNADRLLLAGNGKKAAVLYSRVLKSAPPSCIDSGTQYYRLAGCLYCQHKYEKAIERYNKAAELEFPLFYTFNGIGSCFSNLENYEEAIESFGKALDDYKSYDLVYINWALALFLQGKEKEALEMFENVKDCGFGSDRKNKVLGIYKDEIVFINTRIANSKNQDEVKLAQERLKGIKFITDLINKFEDIETRLLF